MFSTEEACRKRVYVRAKKGHLKKMGKVRAVVFHPVRAQVVGYIVRRPDLLLMFKRKDRFCAADRVGAFEDGLEAAESAGTWDKEACRRLGIDYDACLLWVGMPVRTEDGRELGAIKNVFFDEVTLRVDHIDISTDSMARTLLGESDIARDMIVGFKDGAIIVKRELGEVDAAGGVAAAAGEAWARAKSSAQEKAGKAGQAVDKGAFKVGEAVGAARKKMNDAVDGHAEKKAAEQAAGSPSGIDKAATSFGRQLGRASHMFKDFKDEFDKASRGE